MSPPRADYIYQNKHIGRLTQEINGPTLLLVTHHIEEIRPWLNHTLILKKRHILAHGPTASVVNSEILSDAFHRPCHVDHDHNGYRLIISPV